MSLRQFFVPVSAAQYQEQCVHILSNANEEIKADIAQKQTKAESDEANKRTPGRPRKIVQLNDALLNAADESKQEDSEDQQCKRSKYCDWLHSPLMHDILEHVRIYRSARAAVEALKKKFPKLPTETEGRFDRLSESTVRGWFDTVEWKLRPSIQRQLQTEPAVNADQLAGRPDMFHAHPEIESKVKDVLRAMRDKDKGGISVGIDAIRWVMRAVIEENAPELLSSYKLSRAFICKWARNKMNWTWRSRTTAAAKLPLDWQSKGIDMAKRIAVHMELDQVHPSLVINFDQTAVQLVPIKHNTYEVKGTKDIAMIGADDKRQITVVVASSLDGDLLPLQLVFQGKTSKSLPAMTPAVTEAGFHLTCSHNHWSSQETMKQYIEHIIMPYSKRKISQHCLPAETKIVLVLDVWSVHKSEEFRRFLRQTHPRIHLVYVPPNCTSKLQVADAVLNRPFKHGIKKNFAEWTVSVLRKQVADGSVDGFAKYLGMKELKPRLLDWTLKSWQRLAGGEAKELILKGWQKCTVDLFNVHSKEERKKAVNESASSRLQAYGFMPEGEEQDAETEDEDDESDHESDDDKDELDVLREITFGTRRSSRKRKETQRFGYRIDTSALMFSSTEDEKEQ